MSQTDGVAQAPPSPNNPPSALSEPKAFLVPRWMFGAAATLIMGAVTVTLIFSELAKKTDLKALQDQGQKWEKRLTELENTQVAAYAYGICVSNHLKQMQEFSMELAKWAEKQSSLEVLIWKNERENPRDIVQKYSDRIMIQFLIGAVKIERRPDVPNDDPLEIRAHEEGLWNIKQLYEGFKMELAECLNEIRPLRTIGPGSMH